MEQRCQCGHRVEQHAIDRGACLVCGTVRQQSVCRKYDERVYTQAQMGEALAAARDEEREICAKVADLWANSHSCDSHDYEPCCHVRTGFSVAAAIRARKETEE